MIERARAVTDHVASRIVGQIDEVRRRRTAPLILELDLTEPLVDSAPHDPLSAVMARRRTSLRTVLDGLHRAGGDPRVRALVVKLGGPRAPLALARAQELRDAVTAFRAAGAGTGKLTVAWAETFGELGRGSVPYYLATAFDEIWLQPSGEVGLTGVASEMPFLHDALDKLGITPQVAARHEYKSAASMFTDQELTPANREATERLVASIMDQLVDGVAAGRGIDAEAVRALVERAPLLADDALEAGLVDHLGYRDEVYAAVRDQVDRVDQGDGDGDGKGAGHDGDASLLYVARYQKSKQLELAELSQRLTRASSHRPKLALVPVTGAIHLGKSGRQPFARESTGSDTVAAALRAATADDDVRAIVLRISSPGGSYVASDTIWRQVALAREAGKPVVASMADVAASGGYYVAMGADAIVAQPATITGSIGVLAGKPVVDRLAARLGVGRGVVAGSSSALMLSPFQPFTDDEWQRLDTWLDHIYADFVTKAAAGRGLSYDRLHELARGRVWTGADAHEHGLVDELGGLDTAVALAKERAGLAEGDETDLVPYPQLPLLARVRPAASSDDEAAALARVGLDAWGTFAPVAAALGLPTAGPLTLPAELARLT
ncbi:MAG TPA: signal peptide peptidase SppA [Acidimicrobiales bacterium]|nr:signal peptide peptidase SppA [Acidimicrobiales bacterium]